MAKGKHKRRSELRQQQRNADEAERIKQKISEQQERIEKARETEAEMRSVARQVIEIQERLEAWSRDEVAALERDVTALTAEVAELQEAYRRRYHRVRNMPIGVAGLELLQQEMFDDPRIRIVVHTHIKGKKSRKLTYQQVMTLERVRGRGVSA